jgi:hypothetical protein
MLRYADISKLHEAPPEIAHVESPARNWSFDDRWNISRTTLLKGVAAAGVAWSLSLLEMFPLARIARADGYDIWTDGMNGPCAAGNYAENHQCSPGCGPSAVCGGVSDGDCCTSGWHRTDGTEYSGYQLRPNECWQNYYDGWFWRCSPTLRYRCHDGWTYSGTQSWKTTCRHVV